MAKSLVRNRHAVNKLFQLKSQLQAVSLRIAVRPALMPRLGAWVCMCWGIDRLLCVAGMWDAQRRSPQPGHRPRSRARVYGCCIFFFGLMKAQNALCTVLVQTPPCLPGPLLQTLKSTHAMGEAMAGATKAMGAMNRRMNLPAVAKIMREFEKQNERMEMTSEMMGDAGARCVGWRGGRRGSGAAAPRSNHERERTFLRWRGAVAVESAALKGLAQQRMLAWF